MTTIAQNELATALIAQLEGIRLDAYLDSAKPPNPTIGIGTTHYSNGDAVQMGDHCTTSDAYVWLNYHLNQHVYPAIDKLCNGFNVPDKVVAALCSIAYNEGSGILSNESFVTPVHNNDWNELAETFRMYQKIRINGVLTFSQSLADRRETEIAYFLGEPNS